MNFQVYSFVNISNIIENAVSSFRTEYYLSSSNTELIGGSWSTNIPPWSNGKYYWQRTVTTFTDPTKQPEISKPVCITGAAGHDGKGVVSIVPEYAISQSSTESPVSGWADKPKKWMFGYYLWTRFKITYTDKTTTFTTPTCDSSWEIANNIEIGGKNLLTCTSSIMGYNDDQRNWTWKSWKTVMTNTVDKLTDSIHIVTQGGDVDINSGIAFNTKKIDYKIGETYTFSIAVRGTYNLTDKFIAHIYYTNKENKEVYDKTEITWIDNQDGINDGLSSIRFQRRFITFTVPDDYNETTNNLLIIISCKKMDILLCRPQLERGNKPTDWKVAEEDLQSQIDSTIKTMSGISSLVDKINGNITNKIWVSDINTAVDSFNNTTIQSIRDQVSSQEQTLSGFNQTVKDMQTTIEKKADGSTVETLSNKISQTEQSLNGFKTTVENTYATNANLTSNYYNKSQTEQLANKIYWLVTDSSSSSSLTLTSKALEAVTNQFIVKSPDGKRIVLEKGKVTADALQSNNYVAPGHNSVYAQAGTFYNLSDGSITSKNFVVDQYGNVNLKGTVYATSGSFTGDIVANSLTLGSGVSIDGSKITGLSYDNLSNKPDLTIYIKKDGTIGSTPSEGYTGFQVSSSGLLRASNAIIYGTIYASSGNIGGCNISGGLLSVPAARIIGHLEADQIGAGIITVDKITTNNLQGLNGWINLNKGTFNYGEGKLVWDGYNLKINGSGTFTGTVTATSGSFTGSVTATSGSFTGSVYANSGIIGGCNISNGSLQVPAANITGTLSANQIIVGYNTLQSKLDSMATDILNAAKTATNYITMDYNGVMVSDTSQGSYGSNVLIASDGVNIRNGTTTVASFKANEIELGKGNKNSVIKLCDGVGTISAVNDEEHGLGIDIYSENTCIRGDGTLQVRSETSSGWRDIPTETRFTCYGNGVEMYLGINDPQYEHESTIMSVIDYSDLSYGKYTISNYSYYHGNSSFTLNTDSANYSINDRTGESNNFEISSRDMTTNNSIISEQYMQASKGFTCGSATDNFQNNVLWSGTALWPSNDHTCNFSKPVSEQAHGILLVFRGYDGSALNADWHTFFVSKKEISSHQGHGHSFFLSHTPCTNFSTKYIYIYDTYLRGHANNNQSGTGSNGVKYTNNKYALQYVVGV